MGPENWVEVEVWRRTFIVSKGWPTGWELARFLRIAMKRERERVGGKKEKKR